MICTEVLRAGAGENVGKLYRWRFRLQLGAGYADVIVLEEYRVEHERKPVRQPKTITWWSAAERRASPLKEPPLIPTNVQENARSNIVDQILQLRVVA